MISLLIYLSSTGHDAGLAATGYGVAMAIIWSRGYRLKKRVAQLVEATAQRIGLKRVSPSGKSTNTTKGSASPATNHNDASTETQVSPQITSEVSPQG